LKLGSISTGSLKSMASTRGTSLLWFGLHAAFLVACAEGAQLNETSGATGGAPGIDDASLADATGDALMLADREAAASGAGGTADTGTAEGGDTGSLVAEASVDDGSADVSVSDAPSDAIESGTVDGNRDAPSGDASAIDASRDATPDAPVDAGSGPCAGLCANPVIFTSPYKSGMIGDSSFNPLGIGATCHQTTAPVQGFVCGNFTSIPPRTLSVNSTVVTCNGSTQPLPTPRNGGYCFQLTAGGETSEYFMTF
jgi:hypothetical protein